ncbi:MAG: hypothetical protein WCK29_01970 [archaeon]
MDIKYDNTIPIDYRPLPDNKLQDTMKKTEEWLEQLQNLRGITRKLELEVIDL